MEFQTTVTTHIHQLLGSLEKQLKTSGGRGAHPPPITYGAGATRAHLAPQWNHRWFLPPTPAHCLVRASCVVCGPELGRATTQSPQLHFQFTSL